MVSLHNDAGITTHGNVGWAVAFFHVHQITTESSCFISAFFIAAPCDVSLSGFIEEVFVDMDGIFLLVLHVVSDVVLNLTSHVPHGVFNMSSIVPHLMSLFMSLIVFFMEHSAVCYSSTMATDRFSDPMFRTSSKMLALKACCQCIGVACASWLSKFRKSVDQFTSVFNSIDLSNSDGFDGSFGSFIKMFSKFLSFFAGTLMSEPFVPVFVVLFDLFPVVGKSDLAVVGAWLVNLNTH